MLLDDGGDLTAMVHEKYPQMLDSIHGITEETTTGVHRLFDMMAKGELKVPAINVNDSVTKSKNDNKYGCRHSLNDAIKREIKEETGLEVKVEYPIYIKRGTDALLSGKKGLVVGYGDVGKGSAQSLNQEGMIVKISEIDPICGMQACMDGYEVVSPYKDGINTGSADCINKQLLEKIDLIVTTTGNVNVCDRHMLAAVKRGAIVCNIGHFDLEIDTKFMRNNWRWEEVKPQVHKIYRSDDVEDYIILLSEGRLVNLGNATGHPSRIMDGSFTNQVLAQMYLYNESWAGKPVSEREPVYVKVLPKKLDEEVAAEMVKGFGGVITRMTQQQSKYISTPIEGPFKPDTYRY